MHTAKHCTHAKNRSGSGFTLPEFMMAVLAGSLLITGSGVALRSMSGAISNSAEKANARQNSVNGIKLLRSESISKDNSPMLPVIKDAIVKVEKITKKKTEKIIILDPTSVLRRKKDILKAINVFDTKKPSLLVSVNKSDFSPYFDIIEKKNKYFELCKKLNKKIYARQQAKHVYNINTVVWIYKRNSILFEKMRIPKKTIILETPEKFSLELNYPKDKIKMSNIKKYEKK